MRVFQESQRFNQWWLQLLNIGLLLFLGYFMYTWHIAKEAIGNVSANDTIGQVVFMASVVPVLIFSYLLKLNTSIDEVGVHYQFFPFHFSTKSIRWDEIEECYVRTYSPIKEYGGWGYRISIGKNGKVLNVKGNKGIQIALKNNKRLLLGTQMENDAQGVISRYFGIDE